MLDLRRDRPWDEARTSSAETGRHGHVLLAARGKRHREALHGRAEPRLPQHLAGLDVECAEVAVEVADEADVAGGCERSREKGGALLAAPDFLHRPHINGDKLPDVAVAPGHFKEASIGSGASGPGFLHDLAA